MDIQIIRVLGELGLFCLTASVLLYYIPRRLSRKAVEAMTKIRHPFGKVRLVSCLIAFVGFGLLMLLRYREAAIWLISAFIVLVLTILWPVTFGCKGAYKEFNKRKLAEEE